MIDYNDIVNAQKYTYDRKTKKIFNKETKQEIKDSKVVQKVKAAYLVMYLLKEKEKRMNFKDKNERYNTRLKYIDDINNKLAMGILDGTKNGEVTFNRNQIYRDFGKACEKYNDLANAFANEKLNEYGMKCEEINFNKPTQREEIEGIGGSINLKELNTTRCKSNPKNIKNKENYIKNLIEAYDKVETNQHYENRKMNEEKNVFFVMDAIKNGKMDIKNLKNYQFVELLKAADSITLNTGRDILKEFSNIPEVNERLKIYKNNNVIGILNKKKRREEALPKTPLESEKEIANKELEEQGNISSLLTLDRNIVNNNKELKGIAKNEKEANEQLATKRIIARQEGKNPSKIQYIKTKNGLQYKMQTNDERERE